MKPRICNNCGSNKTYVRANGWHQWNHDKDGNWLCNKCYNKIITNPKWQKIKNAIHNPRRIGFKGKRALGEGRENPRKGICKRCGITGVRTELHHKIYDESDPFAHTIELCCKCHYQTKIIYRDRGWFTFAPESGKTSRPS